MSYFYRNCKFSLHDYVQLKNDSVRVYRVVGYRYQFDFTHDSENIVVQYELLRDIDQRIVIANEEDLEKVEYTTFTVKLGKKTSNSTVNERNRNNLQEYINGLLDAYNDYLLLYEIFLDEYYFLKAAQIKEDYYYIMQEMA